MSLGIVTHFYNEEFLLPFWIHHHKFLADEVIMINHNSTDRSLEIISKNAPEHWTIVDTKLSNFDARKNDKEAIEYEKTLKTDLKIILNITEFLFVDKSTLNEWFDEVGVECVAEIPSVSMVDNHFVTGEAPKSFDKLLWKNITYGYIPEPNQSHDRSSRYLHSCKTLVYDIGRHRVFRDHIFKMNNAFILWFGYAPWPYVLERKLQIQHRIPDSDKEIGLGFHHFTNEKEQNFLHSERAYFAKNLLENIEYFNIYNKLIQQHE